MTAAAMGLDQFFMLTPEDRAAFLEYQCKHEWPELVYAVENATAETVDVLYYAIEHGNVHALRWTFKWSPDELPRGVRDCLGLA